MKRLIPTNTDRDGVAVCIKSNYFKMGSKNFQPQTGGVGLIGTITTNIGSPTPRNGFKIIELYEICHNG